MDEELNRAIDSALDELRAVKPAPDFLPRLRTHVEQLPARNPVRWWIPFAASMTAVVAGVVVASLLHPHRDDRPAGATGAERRLASPPAAASDVDARVAGTQAIDRRLVSTHRPRSRTARAAAPANVVLVPPGQLAAIGRLLDAINAGDQQAAAAVRKLGEGSAIEITPITIDPVVVPEMKQWNESKESSQ